MIFKQPYYVSPHAVKRFRERVANLPTKTVRTIIQAALQDTGELGSSGAESYRGSGVFLRIFRRPDRAGASDVPSSGRGTGTGTAAGRGMELQNGA